jgi:tetratricopeptide (TPR) repeat protein
VPDDHLNLLTNETASFDSIHSALARLLSNTEKDHSADTLIIFIAGHGGLVSAGNGSKSPPKAYFLPSNVGSRQDIGTSALEVSNFRSLIAQSALAFRRVIVYLDICFAGYFAFSPEALIELIQAKGGTPGLPNPNNPQLALLMAAAPLTNEPDAWESPTFGGGHGAFTISVLEGLNGQVRTSTRALTAEVLNEWVESETRRLTVAVTKQTPSLSATSGGVQVLADTTIKSEQSLGRIEPMSKQAKRSRTHNEYLYRQAKLTKPSETEGMPAVPGEDAAFTALVAKDPLSVANSFSRDQATQQIPEAIRQRRAGQLRVALKDRGQAVVVRYLRGEQSALAKSDFAQCAAYFRAAMDLEPVDLFDESRMLFCEGRAAIYDKDYTGAVTLLEQSIQLDPERAYAYNALGIAYLEQVPKAPSYFDLAESALKDAIRLAPGWAYPLHNLALAYSERGDFLGASATYQRAMKLAPYYSYLPYNLGLLNQNVNRLGEAERCYRLAIDAVENAAKIGMGLTARDRAVAWNALATVEMARKSYKRADEDLDKALHDDPALAEAKHNRAILLTRKGNTTSPEAERLWRQAIAEDPLAIVERVALADYLERQGRLADAESECREVLRIDANNVDGNRLLAQIYMLEARASDALSLLERVRESLPGDPRVCEEFGDVAAAMKRIGEAVVAYQTAERLFSTSSDRKRVRQKLALISKGPTK